MSARAEIANSFRSIGYTGLQMGQDTSGWMTDPFFTAMVKVTGYDERTAANLWVSGNWGN